MDTLYVGEALLIATRDEMGTSEQSLCGCDKCGTEKVTTPWSLCDVGFCSGKFEPCDIGEY